MIRLLFLTILVLGCGKPASEQGTRPTTNAGTPADWMVFEDDWFRVSYPSGSNVGGGPDGKQDPHFPTLAVVPPSTGKGVSGAFTLQFEKRTSGMLLRDAIQSEVQAGMKERGTLLTPPREVKVVSGKCMTATVSKPTEACPKGAGTCYMPTIYTLCDDSAGRRFNAMTLLSSSSDPSSLSGQAQQEAAVYERILRSLEFKKS